MQQNYLISNAMCCNHVKQPWQAAEQIPT